MSTKNYLAPDEIASYTIDTGIKKVSKNYFIQFLLGILAGAFIAFAAEGSNVSAYGLWSKPETYGLGKAMAGALFGTGLMLVIIAGADLFTGNTLIIMGVLEKKIKLKDMFMNWILVYLGNFVGSIFVAYMIVNSGQLHMGGNMLAGTTIKIAYYKVSLSFTNAFFLGIMCNWLVCLAVWLSYSAKDITGKILGIFFPIWLFITSGFEHSVANMYYISAGILAKSDSHYAHASHLSNESLDALNWKSFIFSNLVPVTLGNIVGGAFFVGAIYWFIYVKKSNKTQKSSI
ncbi:formate/nitrite transporter family protein [Tepidibacter hydrothermalis]|uniref:Formate/nitrite transporter family protein n=1 Tax=Tepidibacter hydrothermalis TaxID=3036126 RepID=A0ABY8EGV5_9FIRM|nr:formate/nitrite transporter family protein [Tepidibacter hydrothermalis]WFD10819.1 formate/nitrite transporter family protein [Tepidibacter hydrothermalis]